MKPNTWSAEQRAEAQAIIARGVTVQQSRRLTDTKMLAEFPDLGSVRTWKNRLIPGEFTGLKPERMLGRLRRFAVILDGGQPNLVTYTDLPFFHEVASRVHLLERSANDRRVLPILAPNGTGKTTVANFLVHQSRTTRAYIRIRPTWREKAIHICNGIASALGAKSDQKNPADAERACIEIMLNNPRTLFIDQAHEGGAMLLHLLRSFVDETLSQPRARFVYLGYDTAWRRVFTSSADAMLESQAFLGRCLKPTFDLYKLGTRQEDVALYLQRSADLPADVAKGLATRITPTISQYCNLRLLEDSIESARAASEGDEAEADVIEREVCRLAGLEPGKRDAGNPEN
jgi:hypothetical protein